MSIADEIIRLKNAKENIKTAIKNKGVEVSDSLTISDYGGLIDNISKDSMSLRLQHSLTEYIVPEGVTEIPSYTFYDSGANVGGTEVTLPDSLETIREYAFCTSNYKISANKILNIPKNLKVIGRQGFGCCILPSEIILPEGLERIDNGAFSLTIFDKITIPSTVKTLYDQTFSRSFLKSAIIKNGVETIGGRVFENSSLTTVYIPNSIKSIHQNLKFFSGCIELEFVTIESGFNCNGLNLSASTKFSVETIISWLEALADRTGLSTYTLTIGTTNLAKLTEEQIAIATAKNWTLA